MKVPKKEAVWGIKAAAVDLAGDHGKCIRRFAKNAKKSVKCLSSPAKTARSIARNAFRSVKIAAVNSGPFYQNALFFIRGHFAFKRRDICSGIYQGSK